jgi:hypothetical protein
MKARDPSQRLARTWECLETKWFDAQDVYMLVFEIDARKLLIPHRKNKEKLEVNFGYKTKTETLNKAYLSRPFG